MDVFHNVIICDVSNKRSPPLHNVRSLQVKSTVLHLFSKDLYDCVHQLFSFLWLTTWGRKSTSKETGLFWLMASAHVCLALLLFHYGEKDKASWWGNLMMDHLNTAVWGGRTEGGREEIVNEDKQEWVLQTLVARDTVPGKSPVTYFFQLGSLSQ